MKYSYDCECYHDLHNFLVHVTSNSHTKGARMAKIDWLHDCDQWNIHHDTWPSPVVPDS